MTEIRFSGEVVALFKVFGITDDILKTEIEKIERTVNNVKFAVEKNLLDVKVVITAKSDSELSKSVKAFSEVFSENIYADFDASLQEVLVGFLKIAKLKISVAESFTGGNVASKIVSVSGASEVFYDGIVAYDSEAKIKRLGVNRDSIERCKPVSSQVAGEMAYGLLNEGKCDIAVSSTGIAGPKSDDSGFPVGLCYLAVGSSRGVSVYRYKFDGTRKEITEKGVQTALFLAIKSVKNI